MSTPVANAGPRRVGWFDDGRPGHRQQSQALLQALASLTPVQDYALMPLRPAQAFTLWVSQRPPAGWPDQLDLLIGCGHGSHLGLLAAQRALGVATTVLMRPSLPLALFQSAIIPQHDQPPTRQNVFVTRGALAPIPMSAPQRAPGETLVLLGGPSRHGRWQTPLVVAQVLELLASDASRNWIISDSPRTPPETLANLRSLLPRDAKVHINEFRRQPEGWLAAQLGRCESVWTTPDSASMVYQALSAGCAVGVLTLARPRRSRVRDGLDRLIAEGLILDFERRRPGEWPQAPSQPLREAQRAAEWLHARLGWGPSA